MCKPTSSSVGRLKSGPLQRYGTSFKGGTLFRELYSRGTLFRELHSWEVLNIIQGVIFNGVLYQGVIFKGGTLCRELYSRNHTPMGIQA